MPKIQGGLLYSFIYFDSFFVLEKRSGMVELECLESMGRDLAAAAVWQTWNGLRPHVSNKVLTGVGVVVGKMPYGADEWKKRD